jgi:hypothetical protein
MQLIYYCCARAWSDSRLKLISLKKKSMSWYEYIIPRNIVNRRAKSNWTNKNTHNRQESYSKTLSNVVVANNRNLIEKITRGSTRKHVENSLYCVTRKRMRKFLKMCSDIYTCTIIYIFARFPRDPSTREFGTCTATETACKYPMNGSISNWTKPACDSTWTNK